jgi:type I restriction enzyme S subunit
VKVPSMHFGDLGQLFDGPHATPTRQGMGPYFLNIASLVDGRLDLARSDHVASEDFARWTKRVTPVEGDLLFSYETRLGDAALMPGDVEACLGRRMALLRPDRRQVDPRFLLYYYLSPAFQTIIDRHTIHGATVNRIGLSTMGSWPIVIPDLNEQRAIGEVLGVLDDKIATDEQAAKTAIELGNSIFDRMSSGSTLSRTQLGELVDCGGLILGDGYRTKRLEHGQPGLRILRAGDIRDGLIDPVGDDFVSQSFARQIGPKMSQSGDIVMTTKGTVGRVAVVSSDTERLVYSPQLCYFRVVDNGTLDRGYLAAWFRSADLQCQASLRMFKSDMAPYINLQDIRSLEVPIVPFEQQRQQGETQLKLLELFDGARAEIKRLVRLRDVLLPQLMSGRIRVRDAKQIVGDVV